MTSIGAPNGWEAVAWMLSPPLQTNKNFKNAEFVDMKI
jgi:hypothetical protein